jgi:N-carbamoyl-L-amino-acid hydrolase
VDQALAASRETTGSERVLTSGALHDAAEAARVIPTAMLFCPSIAGLSHAKEEDTNEADLIAAIEAFGLLANRVLGSDLA